MFDQLGPGLVTGAADDDPSGISTYSQAVSNSGSICCPASLTDLTMAASSPQSRFSPERPSRIRESSEDKQIIGESNA